MLADLCDGFQKSVEELDPKADDFAFELKLLIMGLVKDLAVLVGDASNQFGEIPAVMHLAHGVLTALQAESNEPENRRCRYRREQALLDLLMLCDVTSNFYGATYFEQRKVGNIDALKTAVSDALAGLLPPPDE